MKQFTASCKKCRQSYEVDTNVKRYCGRCLMTADGTLFKPRRHEMIIIENPKWKGVDTAPTAGEKICGDCGESKDYSLFHKDGNNKTDGCTKRCKACYKVWNSPEEIKKRKDEKRKTKTSNSENT